MEASNVSPLASSPRLHIQTLQLCSKISEPVNPTKHEAFLVTVSWRIREAKLKLQQRKHMDQKFKIYSSQDGENDKRESLKVLRDHNQLDKLQKFKGDDRGSMRVLVWNMTSMEANCDEMVLMQFKRVYDVDVVCLLNANDPFNLLSDFWKLVRMDSVLKFRGNAVADSVHIIWDSNKIALRSYDVDDTLKTFFMERKNYANWLVPHDNM